MKYKPFGVKLVAIVLLLLLESTCTLAQMPAYPKLLDKINRGTVAKPFVLKNLEKIRSNGVDAPWASNTLKTQNALKKTSRIFGNSQAPTGTWKALVILVQFSDKPKQVNSTYYDTLLFQNSPGTLRDYYHKISYNNLDIVTVDLPSAIGWQTAPQTYAYYCNGQNGMGSYPQNSQKLVEDVVQAVDPIVDFSQYDNDGDGYVDALFIVHAGPGAEFTGNSNDIWSHAWATVTQPVLDGVTISRYSIEPEYWATPGDMTIGVFAHELGHSAFGLPDLYDVDYTSAGLGRWSLMAGGSWNGTLGNSPSFPDAYCRIQMGFVSPTILTSNLTNQAIPDVEDNPTIYRLWTNGVVGSQYFLVENRQLTSFDQSLPNGGLLIYHVDESVLSGNMNEWYPGHTSSGHYLVALEQADGLYNLEKGINSGDAGDSYPGSTNNQNFSSSTTPDSKDYNLITTGVGVKNISSSSLTMNADLQVVGNPPIISVNPPSFSFDVPVNGTDNGTLTISNIATVGSLDLNWSLIEQTATLVLKNGERLPVTINKSKNRYQEEFVGKFNTAKSEFNPITGGSKIGFSKLKSSILEHPKNKIDAPGDVIQSVNNINTAGDVIRTIPAPGNVLGLTYLNGSLWAVVGNTPEEIVELNPADGSIISSFTLGSDWYVGLASDGTNLWACNFTSGLVEEYSTSGTLLTSFSAPNGLSVRGIAWDGTALWVGGADSGMLYRVDVYGNVLETRTLPSSLIGWGMDMEWVPQHTSGHLWIGDYTNGDVNQFNVSSNPPSLIQEFPHPDPGNEVEGLAHDGTNLWLSAFYSSYIYQVDDGIVEGGDCPWISENQVNGTVPASGSQVVNITLDATGLAIGGYDCNLLINSNDPSQPQVIVPVHLNVQPPTGGFLNLIGVNSDAFPDITSYAYINTPSGLNGTLPPSAFSIKEDGVSQTITSIDPIGSSGSKADIVFVFDDTGSMSDKIATMQADATQFATDVINAGIDSRFGLVTFKDAAELDLPLTSDVGAFQTAVNNLVASGGGDAPELDLDACVLAINNMAYRPGVQKVFVLVTDATTHFRGDGSGFSNYLMGEVIDMLNANGITLFAVSPNYALASPKLLKIRDNNGNLTFSKINSIETRNDKMDLLISDSRSLHTKNNISNSVTASVDSAENDVKYLALETGGIWQDINSANFSLILNQIVGTIVNQWIIKYTTTNVAHDGTTRIVELTVNDPDAGVDTATNSYVAPSGAGADFSANFEVFDNCSGYQNLKYGTAADASDGYDPAYDQYSPPPPPTGAFDARFTVSGEDYLKDFRHTNTDSTVIWDVLYQPASGCSPVSFKWNNSELPSTGSFRLVDFATGGSLVNIDMRTNSSYTDSYGLGHLRIVFSFTKTVTYNIRSGWNMLSLPLQMNDTYYLTLFPNAIPGTLYGWSGAYNSADSLVPGNGYWLRFPAPETVTLEGFDISSLSLNLIKGWNMIGGPFGTVPLSTVGDPGNIIIPGTLYGWNGTYFSADTIKPGMGYWIRTNAAGTITLNSNAAKLSKNSGRLTANLISKDQLQTIEISDANNVSQKLFFGVKLDENINIESFSMPPIPPTGSFDARFEGGYRLIQSDNAVISVQSSSYPLSIKFSNLDVSSTKNYVLETYNGNQKIKDYAVTEGQEISILNNKVNLLKLVAKDNLIPTKFAVEQNYPNPFNPTTTIKFAIPLQTRVDIIIYNSLGQQIKTLVSSVKAPGNYSVIWNGTNDYGVKVSSGVYFYTIKTDKHYAVKKMILLK